VSDESHLPPPDPRPTPQDDEAPVSSRAEVIAAPDDAAREHCDENDDSDEITGMVEQPAKVMRIGTMIKQLL
jgi:Protein of unknown function (DUF2587)